VSKSSTNAWAVGVDVTVVVVVGVRTTVVVGAREIVVVGVSEVTLPLPDREADVVFPVWPISPSQTTLQDSVLKVLGTWSQK